MMKMNYRILATITIILVITSVSIGSHFIVSSSTVFPGVSIQRQDVAMDSTTGVVNSVSTTSESSTTNNTISTDSVDMTVIRITNNTNAFGVNYSAIRTVSHEVVIKYTLLQNALPAADKQLDDFNKQCENYKCRNTLPLRIIPAYDTQIPATVAKMMIGDPDLHFGRYLSPSLGLKVSYMDNGGIVYAVYLQVPP
jgi:hypothetical protein